MLAGEAKTVDVLGELIAVCSRAPVSASHADMPYRDVKRTLAGIDSAEAADPSVVLLKSGFFRRPLPREAIDGLLRRLTADRPPGESRELDFTPLGGAYGAVAADATAYAHRGERFLLEHTATLDGRASATAQAAALAWATASWACARPWGSGRVYANFPDPDLEGWAEAYHGDNLHRLLAVKATYDPDDVFRFHPGLAVRGQTSGRYSRYTTPFS